MATNNAINSNIPIEISKGGISATSFATTDGVVYYDGTSLVTSSAGTSGQVLTSNGAGVAPTYQALPGTMVLLNTQTGSSSASLAFTSTYITSTYGAYLIKFTDIVSSASAQFQMQFSVDNGSNYLATNYIAGASTNAYNGNTWSNANSTTLCPLTATGITWLGITGYIYINIPQSASVFYNGKITDYSSGACNNVALTGVNTGTTTVNNIKFLFSSGNITSGTISLYGLNQ